MYSTNTGGSSTCNPISKIQSSNKPSTMPLSLHRKEKSQTYSAEMEKLPKQYTTDSAAHKVSKNSQLSICRSLLTTHVLQLSNLPLQSLESSTQHCSSSSNESDTAPKLTISKTEQSETKDFVTSKQNMCSVCGKCYSRYSSLYKHKKKSHNDCTEVSGHIECKEEECFHYIAQLRNHLTSSHNITIEEETMLFSNVEGEHHYSHKSIVPSVYLFVCV